ncbi:helix-turn-helix domain-containing protein [Kaistia nematophila]|uniref:Helix-turn-helix domain-containing protein n=1 Tax=Kaistia nematophila TaxID=2994654 RepID=A0A9X3IL14_9HYPH|nr:helix-turn-helix domain-containing protein [Kaistia nematophila]MCX5568385.1 helix-turn-helix domain-containing protein [Kaistia nematophila]
MTDVVEPVSAPSPLIQPIVFSTAALPARSQFEAWRNLMSPVIDFDVPDGREGGFPAEQRVWDVGGFALTRARMPADGRLRVWQHIRKNPLDHWCFVLVNDGTGPAVPSSRPEPRQIFFRSLAEPFDGAARDTSVLTLYAPRELFGEGLMGIGRGSGVIADVGLGALLGDYFLNLEKRLPGVGVADLPQVVEATRAMIAACVRPSMERVEVAHDAIVATLMERARVVIRQNLGSVTFGPDRLAQALGVSRSKLYRMFEPFGGVARYVHRQRLVAAHSALSDVANKTPIIQIAEALGFSDASGFSRAFKQEFGHSPSEARLAAVVGAPLPSAMRRAGGDAGADFGEMLRRLCA